MIEVLDSFSPVIGPLLFVLALAFPLSCGLVGRPFWMALLVGWALFILPFLLEDLTAAEVPEDFYPPPRSFSKAGVVVGWFPATVFFMLGWLGKWMLGQRGKTFGWNRFARIGIGIVALLWWPGVRLYYHTWVSASGTQWAHQTDFNQLPRVIPPPDAMLTAIHPGLPHQMFDDAKLLRDLFMTRNWAVGGYRFQSAEMPVPDEVRQRLDVELKKPELYVRYGGPKLCGGYHPDYCFKWESEHGTFYALLCRGCGEVRLIGNGTAVHCDIRGPVEAELDNLLKQLTPP